MSVKRKHKSTGSPKSLSSSSSDSSSSSSSAGGDDGVGCEDGAGAEYDYGMFEELFGFSQANEEPPTSGSAPTPAQSSSSSSSSVLAEVPEKRNRTRGLNSIPPPQPARPQTFTPEDDHSENSEASTSVASSASSHIYGSVMSSVSSDHQLLCIILGAKTSVQTEIDALGSTPGLIILENADLHDIKTELFNHPSISFVVVCSESEGFADKDNTKVI